MDIKTFIQCATSLPPEIAILAKGATGVGKSTIVKALANLDKKLEEMEKTSFDNPLHYEIER